MTAASSSELRIPPVAYWVGLAVILGVAMWMRAVDLDHVLRADGVLIYDNDTLRRLARIEALADAPSYPFVNLRDGFPSGTAIHWTRPMDWVIQILNPVAGMFVANAKGYEAGAVVAGPVLSFFAILLVAWSARRLFGNGGALCAAAIYAFGYSIVNVSLFGNGDHQGLQHLCVVAAFVLLLRALENRDSGDGTRDSRFGLGSGLALGLGIWVSAETMTVLYALLAAGLVAFVLAADKQKVLRTTRDLARGSMPVVLLGHWLENSSLTAFLWDGISLFQLWQLLVLWVFGELATKPVRSPEHEGTTGVVLRQTGIAAAVAIVAGIAPFAFESVRTAFGAQLANAAEVNIWLQNEVAEFRSLFGRGQGFSAWMARDSYLVLVLPIAVFAAFLWRSTPLAVRTVIAVFAVVTLGLEMWEIKLGHLFALAMPFALICGFRGLADRLPVIRGAASIAAAAIAILAAYWARPGPRVKPYRDGDVVRKEVCGKLADRSQSDRKPRAVMAPWDFGGWILYHTKLPVVASGYHRNLDGIQDSWRFYLAQPEERDAAWKTAKQRKVGYVLAWYSRGFLAEAPPTIGRPPLITDRGVDPRINKTLFWELRYGQPQHPGLRLFAKGQSIQFPGDSRTTPMYQLYELRGQ